MYELPHIKLDVYVTERQYKMLKMLTDEANAKDGGNNEPEDTIRQILYLVLENYKARGYDV